MAADAAGSTNVETRLRDRGCEVSRRRRDAEALSRRGSRELTIPGDEGRPRSQRQGAGKVDGVVATQAELRRQLAGLASELTIDPDRHQLVLKRFEVGQSVAIGGRAETTGTTRARDCGPPLRVSENARCDRMRDGPRLDRQLRAGLGDDELDQRRRIEVEVQRRWSATRSETEPRAFTRGAFALRRTLGSEIRPRWTRESSDSSSPRELSRATGLPRRVTTISAPRSTRSRCSLRRSCSSRTPTSVDRRCSVIGRAWQLHRPTPFGPKASRRGRG